MTIFDHAVLTVIAVSVLLGLWRGVVGELLALAAWVAGFLLARAKAGDMAPLLANWIREPGLQLVLAYALIFLATLLVFAIGRRVMSLLVKAVGLGLADRLLGALFGVARGSLVVVVAVMLAGLTPLPTAAWWRSAMLSPPLETAVIAAKPWLPPDLSKRIRYR